MVGTKSTSFAGGEPLLWSIMDTATDLVGDDGKLCLWLVCDYARGYGYFGSLLWPWYYLRCIIWAGLCRAHGMATEMAATRLSKVFQ